MILARITRGGSITMKALISTVAALAVALGAEGSVAAGPVGRDARAGTDAQVKAEILSYSRSQGLFAGIDISGGVLKPDKDENGKLYGKNIEPRAVVLGGTVKAPADAR